MPCASCLIHPETKGQGERAEGVGDKGEGGVIIPELCGLVLLDCWAHFAPRPLLWRPWAPQAPARKKKARRKAQKHWDMLFLVRKKHVQIQGTMHGPIVTSTRGLVAMTSASHAEGRQFDPGQV